MGKDQLSMMLPTKKMIHPAWTIVSILFIRTITSAFSLSGAVSRLFDDQTKRQKRVNVTI